MQNITINDLQVLNEKKAFNEIVLWLLENKERCFEEDELAEIEKLKVTDATSYQEEERGYWRFFYKKLVIAFSPDKHRADEANEWTDAFRRLNDCWQVFTTPKPNNTHASHSKAKKEVTRQDVNQYIQQESAISCEKVQSVFSGGVEDADFTEEEKDLEFALSTMLVAASVWTSLAVKKKQGIKDSEKIFQGISVGFGELDGHAIRICENEPPKLCLSFLIPLSVSTKSHQLCIDLQDLGFKKVGGLLGLSFPPGKQPFQCTLDIGEFSTQPDLAKRIIAWAKEKEAGYLQQIDQLLAAKHNTQEKDVPAPRIEPSHRPGPGNRLLKFLSNLTGGGNKGDGSPPSPPSPKL